MRNSVCEFAAKPVSPLPGRVWSILVRGLLLIAWSGAARGQERAPLRVRLEVGPGPFYTGQGIELAVAVTGRDQRPAIELPRPSGAELWTCGTLFQPINATGIGQVTSGENVYITRLRLVPRRPGPLEVPPVLARLGGQSGRSRSLRLAIEPVPLEGRPAEFLGGVGDLALEASVTPASARVGQELLYRIRITGPAAWGTTSRPDLSRLERISLAPRIQPLPDEVDNEPPARTFVFRIRPTRAGTAALPPVAVAAFDPSTMRYITRVTRGLPIRAVAVAPFDPRTIDYSPPAGDRLRTAVAAWGFIATAMVVLVGGTLLAVVARRRRWLDRQTGPGAARRFARRVAHELGSRRGDRVADDGQRSLPGQIIDGLIAYSRIGTGRPPGALTPEEAEMVVLRQTGSETLAAETAALVERCDRELFSTRPEGDDVVQLGIDARELFLALGRVPVAAHDRFQRTANA